MKELQKAIRERGVKYALHFTRLANLPSILEDGLVPRNELESCADPPDFNDEHRFDLQKDAVCCSIGFPNYKMFYSLRQQHDEEWIVCVVKSSVLWKKECAFCVENAASSSVTSIPIEDRKGLDAFHAMYTEVDGKPVRTKLGISDSCPTNPQAEVLVFGKIEPNYILGAGCYYKETASRLASQFGGFDFQHTPGLFSARKDYQHW